MALSGNSSGNQVLVQLKKFMPDYEKGRPYLFRELIHYLDVARKRAEQVLRENERSDTDNPGTRVHQLISVLQKLNSPS